MKKIIQNFIYQSSYQLLLIILPIITIPIVSNSLGVRGIGTYNYINSVITYFTLVAGLGLANYGIREIASVRENKKMLSKRFSELLVFNILITVLVTLAFFIFVLFVGKYRLYFMLSSFSIIACIFDISWFFAGIEDFKIVTMSNFFVKIISFVLIIFFIKKPDDLIYYFLIQSLNILVSNVIMCFFLKGKVRIVRVSAKGVFGHLKPAFEFFYGKIAISLYTTLSTTLLGVLASVKLVGLYSNSMQLQTIIVTVITTLDTVLMPRLTYFFESNNLDRMISVIEKTFHIQFFLSIPAMFGLVSINDKLIPWFFGNSFSYLKYTVPALAPLVIIIPLGTSIMRQYLMPKNEISKFNFSVYVGAFIGLIANLTLIPFFQIWGAIIASLLSEVSVTVIRLKYLLDETNFTFQWFNIFKYTLSALFMSFVIQIFTGNMSETIMTTIVQIMTGIITYFLTTVILHANPITDLVKEFKKNN